MLCASRRVVAYMNLYGLTNCQEMINTSIGIYRFYNKATGKSYIGQSRDLDHRYSEHIHLLRKGIEPCVILNRAWSKYGEDNFEYEVLCYCEESELNSLESKYIDLFDSYRNGYNCTTGGGGISGYHHSDESKEKIGLASRGRKLTYEQRVAIGKRQKGKTLSEAHKSALSDAWNEERKTKFSKSRSGINNPNFGKTGADACNTRAVIASTGEEFSTVTDAALWCGILSKGNISSCCNHKRKFAGRHPITNEQLSWQYKSI